MEHFHLLPSTWRGEESFVVIAFLFSLEQLVRTSMNLKKMNCKVTHSFEQRNGCCSMLTPNLNHRGEEEIFNDKRLISGLFEQRGRELRFDMKWEGRCFSFFSPSLFVVFSNIFCENGRTNKVFRIAKTISKFSNRIFVNQWLTIKNWFLFYSDDQIWTKTKRESRERERERRKSLFKLRIGMRPLAHSCSMLDAEEKTNDRGQRGEEWGNWPERKWTIWIPCHTLEKNFLRMTSRWTKMKIIRPLSIFHRCQGWRGGEEKSLSWSRSTFLWKFDSVRRRHLLAQGRSDEERSSHLVRFSTPALPNELRHAEKTTNRIRSFNVSLSFSIISSSVSSRSPMKQLWHIDVNCLVSEFFDVKIFQFVLLSTLNEKIFDVNDENLPFEINSMEFVLIFPDDQCAIRSETRCSELKMIPLNGNRLKSKAKCFPSIENWSFCSLNCWSDWANLSLSDLISSENIDTDRKFFVARLSTSTVCQRSFIVECALLLVVFDILILRRILLRSSLCLSRWISSSISPSNTLIQSIRIARLSPKLWLNLRRRVFSIVDTIDFVSFQREHLIFSVTIHNSTERPKMSIIPPVSIFMSKRPNWSLLPVRNLSHRTAKICSNILPPIHSLITVFNYFPSSRFLLIFKLVFVFGLVDFQSNKREFLQRTTNVVHRWWLFSHPHLLTLATSRSFETIWQTGIISLTNSFFIQSFSLQRKNIDLRKRKFSFKSIDWGKHQGSIAADEIQSNAANPDIEEDWIMILNEHSKIHIRQIIKNKTFYESNIKPSMIAILLMLLFQPRIPAETSSTTMSCSIANKQTSRGSIPSKKSPLGGWSINWKRRSWTAKMNDE